VAKAREALGYVRPTVTDYGGLLLMTSVVRPLLADVSVHDLSFSSPAGPPEPGSGNLPLTTGSHAAYGATGTEQGGTDAGTAGSLGSSAGEGGNGDSLPFTGFAPGVAALIGAGFTAAGTAIRRALRRS
jgi:hypothetical protein